MRRKPSDRIQWDRASLAIEKLDWRDKPEEFERLHNLVAERLRARLMVDLKTFDETVTQEELRSELRRLANRFQDKHLSLAIYVQLGMQRYIGKTLRDRGVPYKWRRTWTV